MKILLTALAVLLATSTIATASLASPRQCNPEKSKPCGRSCIILGNKCNITTKSVDDAIVKPKK